MLTHTPCDAATATLATASVPEEEHHTLCCAPAGNLELPAVLSSQPETYAGVLSEV
jgi:hypothetical protein